MMRVALHTALWLSGFISLAFSALTAQTYPVHGTLYSAVDSAPVAGAEVYVENTNRFDLSTETGQFSIGDDVPPGNYRLIVIAPGFKTTITPFQVEAGMALTIRLDTSSLTTEEQVIVARRQLGLRRLAAVEGCEIFEGRKTEVISIADLTANLATNNPRQVFNRVAGLNIWESDGAGIQLGIGGRGLNPNRTSNFNSRQNGYDISADALGYPEAYYTPPVEALERISVVRGAASLQYGTQFGGLLNFHLKRGPLDQKFQFTSRQTYGSWNFFNSFNSIGGTVGKVNYYGFYQYKRGDGQRPNSGFDLNMAYGSMRWQPNRRLTIGAEYTFMHYVAQQPGGLTDAQFEADPLQSNRARNWFQVDWNLMAVTVDYTHSENLRFNSRTFGLIGGRDALGILSQINRADLGGARDLLADDFQNIGNETRVAWFYTLFGANKSVLGAGVRYYRGNTIRKQGLGSDDSGPQFRYLNPENLEHSDFRFPSQNVAVFAENIFNITNKISLTPGIRAEWIQTRSIGTYRNTVRNLAGDILLDERIPDDQNRQRKLILLGLGASYKPSVNLELYANISQNYRAVNFNDLRVVNPNFRVDPNLQDERGYTADLGLRGNCRNVFNYDVSAFYLSYANRIGTVLRVDSVLQNVYRYRTNVAASRTVGLETYLEVDLWRLAFGPNARPNLALFTNITVLDGQYISSDEPAYDGKKVEQVPPFLFKTGLQFRHKGWGASLQFSRTAEHFSDATNATRTPNAVEGIIPAYWVMDATASYTWRMLQLSVSANNLTNNYYFTRRATGYPGPGIIPSDGRALFVTLQLQL